METAGYIASVLIGISLGLIGGGGSILTVPVLVYLFSVDAVMATAYSLFIVGTTSLVGSFSSFRKGLVNIRTAIEFGVPSITAVFLTRAYILPAVPDHLFNAGSLTITKSIMLLLLFAFLMIAASYGMIRKRKPKEGTTPNRKFHTPLILLEGSIVGVLTGMVGAGGGFLIIPALVLLSNLPMKEAVGTSLVIIAAKSLIGFMGEGALGMFDWNFLFIITSFAILGIIIGSRLSGKINGDQLKPVFGWFTLLIGVYMIIRETIMK
ncbi:MAG: sulfite exporter TauE/SafE family protein [Bacteroidetes bacterium]|nr:MAG: sulfite exporter TauE/SafE family protein [Bacteroidota bacterium]REK07551.1 MAG: sulfite exporter TauE/SafE family protein [Bacteroidota bacterium]REK37016.1 MAG: sulfite exporter TauE/SafE family protein [Bacteroidota bacterium]REK47837.1 MAG: sulfite exporter TauE/SafE family protein [Bacteroidota bacterium]